MQLRRLAALERQKIIDELRRADGARSPSYKAILADAGAAAADRQRGARPRSSTSTATSGARRSSPTTATCPSRTSSPRRTSSSPSPAAATPSAPRPTSTARSGAAARACAARSCAQDDIVEHFFVTTTHHWILFFTNKGRVYRAKAYELPDAGRDARGQHVANLLAFQPDEQIAQVIDLQGLRGRAVPGARHHARPGQEDPAHASTTPTAPAASSRSTCARTTSCIAAPRS